MRSSRTVGGAASVDRAHTRRTGARCGLKGGGMATRRRLPDGLRSGRVGRASSNLMETRKPNTSWARRRRILPHFGLLLPEVPHAYVVLNRTHACGWVQLGEQRRRLDLVRIASTPAMPLIDVGTTVTPEPFAVDGHLSVVVPNEHCLRCLGHVSDAVLAEIRDAAHMGRYGSNQGRPQVVSFNGLLASAAVTEVLKLVTGFAVEPEGSREWHYDPLSGELRRVRLARVMALPRVHMVRPPPSCVAQWLV